MKSKLLFKEEQSFVGSWMWYIVIAVSILSVVGTALGILLMDESEGTIGLIIAALATGGVVVLFYTSKLHVSIDQTRIYYRYPPFVNNEKELSKSDIKEMYVRDYKPITEYGGWGYRFRFRSGRAMNVAGNVGLQLVLSNDKRLLIGTQKPEAMKEAVRRLKENWEING